jgi:hypothetical protein
VDNGPAPTYPIVRMQRHLVACDHE